MKKAIQFTMVVVCLCVAVVGFSNVVCASQIGASNSVPNAAFQVPENTVTPESIAGPYAFESSAQQSSFGEPSAMDQNLDQTDDVDDGGVMEVPDKYSTAASFSVAFAGLVVFRWWFKKGSKQRP